MRKMKKIFMTVACLCVAVLASSNRAYAAEAELRFSDPSTTVGATFEVTAKLSADENISTANATLTYDTSYLKFVSGDSMSDNNGQIEVTGDAGGNAGELNWTIKFQALKEGSAKVQISTVSAETSAGVAMNVVEGSSSVTIGAGDPSLISTTDDGATATSGIGGSIEVDGQTYTVSGDFSDILIPEGFTKTDMTFEGQTYPATIQESSGKYAMYLTSASGEADFFLYDPDNGKVSPFKQVMVAQDRYIVLLGAASDEKVPSNFQETTLTVEGKEFPAWQNIDATEYYLVYALNSDGEKGFYQYDSIDGTYQRHRLKEVEEEEKSPTGVLGKAVDVIRKNLDKFLIGIWVVILFLLVTLIIVAVKLRHRNEELDDLYDEYGIDEEEDDEEMLPLKSKAPRVKEPERKSSKDQRKKRQDEDEFEEYGEDDFEDEYEDSEADAEDEEYEDEWDSEPDNDLHELAEMLQEANKGKKNKGPHFEDDDTFKMDIIDLD